MAEKKLVIDQKRLNYTGLFSVTDLYQLIDNWLREYAYDKFEKKNEEIVGPTGKDIILELRPWLKITDYAKNEIRIKIFMKDVKEVEVEKDGSKIKLNQGEVQMIFDGYTVTDYENRWENKPVFVFLRAIFDKYIFEFYSNKFEDVLIEDVNHLYMTVKSFLNLYRY